MKKIKYILCIFILLISGCSLFKRDDMENINIITTIYPLEYTLSYLYGDSAIINSIYPDDVNVDTYTFTPKQNKDNSKKDLFTYMGITSDKDIALSYINENKNIKLIDATFGMEYINSYEELWLNPSNLLMISQNIKNGLIEYITNTYLIKEIENKYESLKLTLSELEADIKVSIENGNKNYLFVNNNTFKCLEKYGLKVYVLDDSQDIYEKNLTTLKNYINDNSVKNFFVLENSSINDEVKTLLEDNKINIKTIYNLKNLSDENRNKEKNYIDLMKENINILKEEIY